MSIFTGTIYSVALHMDTNISVILPHDSRGHRGISPLTPGVTLRERPRTLVLLHGLSDNWSAWPYKSRILSYAEMYDIAVIMPEVQRSFYQDMRYGESYFQYISEELPELCPRLFHLSTDPGDLMVCGLSMGGYGALRCALSRPEAFRAVGAFSSAPYVEELAKYKPQRRETMGYERVLKGMFGEDLKVPEAAQLPVLAKKAAASGTKLPIFMTCGTEDELYPDNRSFYEYMRDLGLNVSLTAWPGIHEWGFWDKSVQMFIERFAHDEI